MSSSDLTLRDAALAHAHAGYPVIPLKPRDKARRTRKGTQPSCDPATVRDWWMRMPDANIGVVINDLPLVVFDVDGPDGEASLARLLSEAGLDRLPATYTVTTGRPDGGQHYWFRLPPGAVKLFNQIGGPKSPNPHLDVLFQGLTVAAGSVHESGTAYLGSTTTMPVLSALTELPMALYQVLARRGRPKVPEVASQPPRTRRSANAGTTCSPATVVTPPVALPRYVSELLADFSDGRNERSLKAVTALIRLGVSDENVIEIVLAAPLGGKAREEANPQTWLRDKIDAVRRYKPAVLDREAFWGAVHTSGMSASQIRVLDTLFGRAGPGGVVPMAQAWIGIDSAVSSPGGVVRTLIKKGWLVVLVPATTEYRAVYLLSIPDPGADEKYHPQICPLPSPPPPQLSSRVVFPVHNDAFRCKAGSLHAAYPLLTLLSTEPKDMNTLAGWLRVAPRALADRARSLVAAGLAVQCDGGLALTGDPALPLLDAVAIKAGTAGDRVRAIKSYEAKAKAWRKACEEAGEVGSPTWLKMRRGHIVANITNVGYAALVEHLNGDVDAAVTYLVEQEVEAYHRVDESWASILAVAG